MIWDKWTDIDKNTLFIDFSLCLIPLFIVDIYKTKLEFYKIALLLGVNYMGCGFTSTQIIVTCASLVP